MDHSTLVFLEFALIGIIYFLVYRFVLHVYLKWKMLHAIWLPIAVTLFSFVIGAMAYSSANGWGDLIAVVLVMVFNAPVLAFFLCFGIDAIVSRRKRLAKA